MWALLLLQLGAKEEMHPLMVGAMSLHDYEDQYSRSNPGPEDHGGRVWGHSPHHGRDSEAP